MARHKSEKQDIVEMPCIHGRDGNTKTSLIQLEAGFPLRCKI